MGFWSSLGSAISSGISSVCSAVSSACSAVGSVVSSAFTGVMNNIGTIGKIASGLNVVLQGLSVVIPQLRPAMMVVSVIDNVFQSLGLAKKNQTTEDVGKDVLNAYDADIKPTDYSTYDEYMQAIQDFKLEKPENFGKDYTFVEKFSSGLAVQTWGVEEKFGKDSSLMIGNILKDANNIENGKGFFTPERMEAFLNATQSMVDVVKYFSGKLNVDDQDKVEQQLVKAEQQLNPDKSTNEIYQELDKQRQNH